MEIIGYIIAGIVCFIFLGLVWGICCGLSRDLTKESESSELTPIIIGTIIFIVLIMLLKTQ